MKLEKYSRSRWPGDWHLEQQNVCQVKRHPRITIRHDEQSNDGIKLTLDDCGSLLAAFLPFLGDIVALEESSDHPESVASVVTSTTGVVGMVDRGNKGAAEKLSDHSGTPPGIGVVMGARGVTGADIGEVERLAALAIGEVVGFDIEQTPNSENSMQDVTRN